MFLLAIRGLPQSALGRQKEFHCLMVKPHSKWGWTTRCSAHPSRFFRATTSTLNVVPDYGYWLTSHRFAICHSSRIVSSLSGPFLMSVPDQGMSICSGHVDPRFAGVFRLSHF